MTIWLYGIYLENTIPKSVSIHHHCRYRRTLSKCETSIGSCEFEISQKDFQFLFENENPKITYIDYILSRELQHFSYSVRL